MALAKYNMGSVQNCAHMGDFPYLWPNEFGDSSFEMSGGVFTKNLAISQPSSSLGSPSSGQSNEYVFQATSNRPTEEAHSLINFNDRCNSLIQANCSLLSFQQKNRPSQSSVLRGYYSNWDSGYKQMNPKLENFNCFQTANNFNSISDPEMESSGDWLYQGTTLGNSIQEPEKQDSSIHKRPRTALKKQCNIHASTTTKSKPKSSAPSKGPQSVAAKIRRERISERLKILQELVPNASKVDLVTMLEKAITYVKFLQLQVKALATDELWPTQGGKASDISQVKEAIDAILSGQRDRNSSSSSE